jgi:hypothetical protein
MKKFVTTIPSFRKVFLRALACAKENLCGIRFCFLPKEPKRQFAGLLVFMVLAACADSDKAGTPKEAPPPKPAEIKTEGLICPQVAILREAEEQFDYGGDKPDASQLVAKARLRKVEGDCGYRNDKEKETGVDISFTLQALAARGPRLGGNQVNFPYFIAVVDPADSVLSRQVMTAQFKFSDDKKVAELYEPLHVFIPVPLKSLPSGPDYRVLIGFLKAEH